MNWRELFKLTRSEKLLLQVSLFIAGLNNFTYYQKIESVFSFSNYPLFNVTMVIIQFFLFTLLLSLFIGGRFFKPFLIFALVISSLISYFQDSFGTVIDRVMILNMINTDLAEAYALLNFKLVGYFVVKGILPSVYVCWYKIELYELKTRYLKKLKPLLVSLACVVLLGLTQGKTLSNFLRNHKTLRFYSNPVFFVYSTFSFINRTYFTPKLEMEYIGKDAKIVEKNKARDLVILVVGETARADRFSLNGYKRETNPLLAKEDVVSFTNMFSCGTSTAISVPCMFSHYDRDQFDTNKVRYTENLLDVLNHTNEVAIRWLDNNSNSKGVADRYEYIGYKDPNINTICDPECRDVGMLVGLQEYVDAQQKNDIFIILHMMGSHGPEYFRRVPDGFQKFQPICRYGQLEKCTVEEIGNSYDNTILYTDYFLSEVIRFLKKNSEKFETAMLYVSDHGESLGEKGMYLHGLPYIVAPEEQRKVAAIAWINDDFKKVKDWEKIKEGRANETDHSYLFHSILGLFDVETSVYQKNKDLFIRQ